MTIVEQRDGEVISALAACDALEVSRASLYRRHRPPSPPQLARVPALRVSAHRERPDRIIVNTPIGPW